MLATAGADIEALFCRLAGATPTRLRGVGDAWLEGHVVEVKAAGGDMVAQVRAVKYLPVVVYHRPLEQWYVVPPEVVVAQVAHRRRGMHSENPFECSFLQLKALARQRVPTACLREATVAAIRSGASYPALAELMSQVLVDSRDLAHASVRQVRAALTGLEAVDVPPLSGEAQLALEL